MPLQFRPAVAAGLIGSIIKEMSFYMRKGVGLDVKQNIFHTCGTGEYLKARLGLR